MTKIRLLTIAVIGLLAINLGVLAYLFTQKPAAAAPPLPPGPPGRMHDRPKNIIIEKLRFSKEQQTQYEALIQEHRKAIRRLNEQIRNSKTALYSTLGTDQPAGKDSLENDIAALHKQVEATHYEHFAAIKKLCTPEQLPLFNELAKELAQIFAQQRNGPPRPGD